MLTYKMQVTLINYQNLVEESFLSAADQTRY